MLFPTRMMLAALLALALVACEEEAAEEEPTTPPEVAEEARDARDEAEVEAQRMSTEQTARDRADRRFRDAMRGTRRVEAPDPVTAASCENAFGETANLISGTGAGSAPQQLARPRDQFIGACQHLPAGMQRCMSLRYRMQHIEECRSVRQELDPRFQAIVNELGRTEEVPQDG